MKISRRYVYLVIKIIFQKQIIRRKRKEEGGKRSASVKRKKRTLGELRKKKGMGLRKGGERKGRRGERRGRGGGRRGRDLNDDGGSSSFSGDGEGEGKRRREEGEGRRGVDGVIGGPGFFVEGDLEGSDFFFLL